MRGHARCSARLQPVVWGHCAMRSYAPPPEIIPTLLFTAFLSMLGRLTELSSNHRDVLWGLIQPGGLHTGEETSQTSKPNHSLTLDSARKKVPFPLLQHSRNNWKSIFNKSPPQDTGAKVIYFITKPNRCLSVQQICHRQKCA